MNRREFSLKSLMLLGTTLVSSYLNKNDYEMKHRKVYLVKDLHDKFSKTGIELKNIKSSYLQIEFQNIKKGDVFFLSSCGKLKIDHNKLIGPFLSTNNAYKMKLVNMPGNWGVICEKVS